MKVDVSYSKWGKVKSTLKSSRIKGMFKGGGAGVASFIALASANPQGIDGFTTALDKYYWSPSMETRMEVLVHAHNIGGNIGAYATDVILE